MACSTGSGLASSCGICLLFSRLTGLQTSIVSSFMLVSLLRVQVNVEDPFDELGTDDINLGLVKEVHTHTHFPFCSCSHRYRSICGRSKSSTLSRRNILPELPPLHANHRGELAGAGDRSTLRLAPTMRPLVAAYSRTIRVPKRTLCSADFRQEIRTVP